MGKQLDVDEEREIKFDNIRDLVDNILMRFTIARTWMERAWIGSDLDFQAYEDDMKAIEGRLEDLQNMLSEDYDYFK